MKLTDEQLQELVNRYRYSNLMERYKVLEKYFDIQDGEVVIDGGAYMGDMAQYFSKKVGKKGKVYSFEANPNNVSKLISTIHMINLKNITVFPYGLWNEDKKLPFYDSEYDNAGSLVSDFRKVSDKYKYIRAYKFDTLAKKYKINKVNYVWFNIEGAEVKALEGMKNTLKNNDVKLCISTHKVNDDYTTTDDVINILKSYGYISEPVVGHTMWIYSRKD